MDDDLNTSAALAVLFELARPLRALAHRQQRGDQSAAREAGQPELQARAQLLLELAGVLGLQAEVERAAAADAGADRAETERIEALVSARRAAKAARHYAEADRIREDLRAEGIDLIDRPDGHTDWLRR